MKQLSQEDKLALVDYLAEYSLDPLGFALTSFPWGEPGPLEEEELDPWQISLFTELGNDVRKGLSLDKSLANVIRKAVASGHGIGKSCFVAITILWAIGTRENTRGVVTANTDTQLRTKTWPELAKWYSMWIAKELFEYTATSIYSREPGCDKTWRIDAIPWSANNTEAFAGLHNAGNRLLLVFDEASAIDNKIWEVAEGAMTDADSEIIWLVFGNPTRGEGRFYDCFHRFRHFWSLRQIDSRTVKRSNKALIQEWLESWGEDSDFFKIRVRGVFPDSSDAQFISTALVEEACRRNIHPSALEGLPVIISIDPAWTGGDEYAIYKRQGPVATKLGIYRKNDNDGVMAQIVADFEDKHKADAVFIDGTGGYGNGLYSFGKTMGRAWRLVNFSSSAADPTKYANKRAEIWAKMREWLMDSGIIEDDQVLKDDLRGPQAFSNGRGLLQLESKDDMKRRGVPSPNRADAIAVSFAYPVVSKRVRAIRDGLTRPANMCNTDYKLF